MQTVPIHQRHLNVLFKRSYSRSSGLKVPSGRMEKCSETPQRLVPAPNRPNHRSHSPMASQKYMPKAGIPVQTDSQNGQQVENKCLGADCWKNARKHHNGSHQHQIDQTTVPIHRRHLYWHAQRWHSCSSSVAVCLTSGG